MAGREGFEPPEVLPSTVFKTAAFNHSAISRLVIVEATPRFELGNQGFAGPCLTTWLCRHYMVPEAGLEPARKQYPRDFKSLVSTNSTTRAIIIWSGKRGSNPRPQPWQGCALPLSYSRIK